MKQSTNPVRWSEQHDASLPDELTRSLKLYAEQGPSVAQRERMASHLTASMAAGTSAPTVGALWPRWGLACALCVALGGLLALLGAGAGRTREEPTAIVVAKAPPTAHEPPAVPPAAAPTIAREVAESESTAVPARRRAARVVAPPAPVTPATAVDPGAELRLLAPARQLMAVQPARALELVNEHALTFPQGVFAEERDALTIEALARTGQRDQAERAAQAFTKRYPRSSYRDRVLRALDAHAP